jgi:hypothetical protein
MISLKYLATSGSENPMTLVTSTWDITRNVEIRPCGAITLVTGLIRLPIRSSPPCAPMSDNATFLVAHYGTGDNYRPSQGK